MNQVHRVGIINSVLSKNSNVILCKCDAGGTGWHAVTQCQLYSRAMSSLCAAQKLDTPARAATSTREATRPAPTWHPPQAGRRSDARIHGWEAQGWIRQQFPTRQPPFGRFVRLKSRAGWSTAEQGYPRGPGPRAFGRAARGNTHVRGATSAKCGLVFLLEVDGRQVITSSKSSVNPHQAHCGDQGAKGPPSELYSFVVPFGYRYITKWCHHEQSNAQASRKEVPVNGARQNSDCQNGYNLDEGFGNSAFFIYAAAAKISRCIRAAGQCDPRDNGPNLRARSQASDHLRATCRVVARGTRTGGNRWFAGDAS